MYIKQKPASQNSPLERGRGCVTPRHSFLNPKAVTEADRYCLATPNTSINGFSKHLIPCRASHRNTPLHPLSRGEISHSKLSLPTRKQHLNLPYREGSGVCDARAQTPENQSNHQSPTDTTSQHQTPRQTLLRNISAYAAPFTTIFLLKNKRTLSSD